MEDALFIGSSQNIELDIVLDDACLRLPQLGISAKKGDLIAVVNPSEPAPLVAKGLLSDYNFVYLLFKNSTTYIGLTQFETEIIPEYSSITDPFTISIGVWVGADAAAHLIAAGVAAAIAAKVGRGILDSEHKWSDVDLNEVDQFVKSAKQRYKSSV